MGSFVCSEWQRMQLVSSEGLPHFQSLRSAHRELGVCVLTYRLSILTGQMGRDRLRRLRGDCNPTLAPVPSVASTLTPSMSVSMGAPLRAGDVGV